MKIVMPELNVTINDGFSSAIDIFDRKMFGERLANLIENSGGNPVIALDSSWGEGKSTFINMWRGYIQNQRKEKIVSIYFDAFENDYQKEPFLALASEIYKLIINDSDDKKERFKDAAIKAMKSLARGSLKLSVKIGSAGVIDDKVVDSVGKDISSLLAEQVDDIFKQKFQHAEKDKMALKKFKEYLSSFASDIGNGKPIVFIIDELDRCRPDFALELLENIKHLFSVTGITFLLVTNRVQLESSIKSRYGNDVDASNYLHKFVNIWLSMPRATTEYSDFGSLYFNYALDKMSDDGEDLASLQSSVILDELIKMFQPSYREIERVLSYFAVIINMLNSKKMSLHYTCAIALISYLKACKPESLRLSNGKLSKDIFYSAIQFDELSKVKKHAIECLCVLIEYEFSDDVVKHEMIRSGRIRDNGLGSYPDDIILEVNSWINDISAR